MQIKRKMPLMVLSLVAVPVFLLSILYYSYISKELIASNIAQMKQVLNMEAANLEAFFLERRQEVDYLANTDLVQDLFYRYSLLPNNDSFDFRMDNDQLNEYFQELNESQLSVRDIFVLSPYGMILASTEPASLWIDLSDRQYFKDAMNGKATISNLLVDRVRNESVLFVATPIESKESKEVVGVMAEIIDMKNKSDEIRQLIDSKIGDAYLLNNNGEIIFHTNKSLIGTLPSNPDVREYFQGTGREKIEDSVLITQSDELHYFTFKRIENTDWKLVIEQDMDTITTSAKQALYFMIVLSLLLLTLAISIAIGFTKSITRPITHLAQIMRRNTNGDLSARSGYVNRNELGQLSSDLNYMLDRLDESQTELRQVQDKYALALKNSRDMIWEWDFTNNQFFVSENWEQLTGKEVHHDKVEKIVFEDLLTDLDKKRIEELVDQLLREEIELLTMDFEYQMENGQKKWFSIKANALKENGAVIKISGTLVDNTQKKLSEERIWNLAYINQLTKIPNRSSFLELLDDIIDRSEAVKEFSIIIIDIYNLKQINDVYGHAVGDRILIRIADRLNVAFRNCYHLAGDEFGILFEDVVRQEEVVGEIQRIFSTITEPIDVEGRKFEISACIGVSRFPENGNSGELLIQNADTALYQAKVLGKEKYTFFHHDMTVKIIKRAEIEEILKIAIVDHLVTMHFQPLFHATTKELVGFEALMRMKLENNRILSPLEFIPIAEEIGAIVELGEWALEHVLEKTLEWNQRGYRRMKVSVNVSSIQLNHKGFVPAVKNLMKKYEVDPSMICLEITESVMIDAENDIVADIDELRNMGFKIAIDDFGTGYSTFNNLGKLPLDYLKIDKSFVDFIVDNKKDRHLLKEIIEIAHQIMELKVIAEGVETEAQYTILRELNCDLIQGYYFSKPLSLEKCEELLESLHQER